MTASHACKLGNFHVRVSATTGNYDSVGVIHVQSRIYFTKIGFEKHISFFITELFAVLFSQTSVVI